MQKIHVIALATALSIPSSAVALDQIDSNNFIAIEALAYTGDYQAQRNLAYGYAAFPYKGQQKNKLLACAWYQVILNSGSTKLHQGDVGNARLYCSRLAQDERAAATGQARQLYQRIYKKPARF